MSRYPFPNRRYLKSAYLGNMVSSIETCDRPTEQDLDYMMDVEKFDSFNLLQFAFGHSKLQRFCNVLFEERSFIIDKAWNFLYKAA
ncbi:hypothetical protein AVEN_267862-1 [Araneus ventricosus]|uniref:Uncharacterized protein n=1 Tax=Araneus ventricosus TaxID=182803 RepID=A0A4Y2PKG2_ARAVE|nr:hypothetical protein AVEN_267862-1 [Araneus ventricosus]